MTSVPVHCPDCQGVDVVRYGKQRHGPQRYRCNHTDCPRHIVLLAYRNHGRLPAVKHQMVDMALNGSGIRDTTRVLRVSPTTVITTLKKKRQAYSTSADENDIPSCHVTPWCRWKVTVWPSGLTSQERASSGKISSAIGS